MPGSVPSELTPTAPIPDTNDTTSAKKIFSPRYILTYLVLTAVVIAAIYFLFLSEKAPFSLKKMQKNEPSEQEASSVGVSPDQFVFSLNDNSAKSGGIAVVAEEAGKVNVQVSLAQTEATPSAYIRGGDCVNMGVVRYTLNPASGGVSTTDLGVSISDFKKQLPLVVAVESTDKTSGLCGEVK